MRPCLTCGWPTTHTRCPQCMVSHRGGTTHQRGYGANHQTLRDQWAAAVARGEVACGRCGIHLTPDEPWDLGHDDHDRSTYTGPEHQACNRGAST